MHPQKVTVGAPSCGVIGPYFFDNAVENMVTMNGQTIPQLKNNIGSTIGENGITTSIKKAP